MLNRVIKWEGDGAAYEADPRHVEIILKQLNLESCKTAFISGTKDEGTTSEDNDEKLAYEQSRLCLAATARCNYLATDRPDIAFATKELARAMSSPTKGDWDKLERMERYLAGRR